MQLWKSSGPNELIAKPVERRKTFINDRGAFSKVVIGLADDLPRRYCARESSPPARPIRKVVSTAACQQAVGIRGLAMYSSQGFPRMGVHAEIAVDSCVLGRNRLCLVARVGRAPSTFRKISASAGSACADRFSTAVIFSNGASAQSASQARARRRHRQSADDRH